jgi:hypothetical protein
MKSQVNFFVFRIVLLFWLLGWFIKSSFYVPYLSSISSTFIQNVFFPIILQNSDIVRFFYFFPLVAVIALFVSHAACLRWISVGLIISSLVCLWHQETYNDATFVVSFWAALWLFWISLHINDDTHLISSHGQRLALGIVSVVFMAGFVGKLTLEYWNGEIVYNIFFVQKPHGLFLLFKNYWPAFKLQQLAMVISWVIMGGEFFLALAFLFPFRRISIVASMMMLLVTCFSTWRILSVMSALMGILLGSRLWDQRKR